MSHAFTPPIELFQPNPEVPSGGNVYNQRLVEAAEARGIALVLRAIGPSDLRVHLREHSTRLRIWDSLFIEALAAQDLAAERHWGLLLHYLPSENPMLDRAERRRLETIEARVLEAAPLVIVTGHALLAPVRHYRVGGPVWVCEPGVSSPFSSSHQKRAGGSDQTVELLTVANMLPAKGLLDLLGILAALRDLPWRWHVVGAETVDVDYTSRFSALATELVLDARIRRHGPLDQHAIAQLMNSMDVFALASRFEAYGMALAEAAAAGLPAVTTDVGAASRIYRHGSTGFLATPGDTDGFTACLGDLLTNADVRKRFRENLRACTPRTWQDTLNDFLVATGTIQ